jgi:hypothetical protein
MTALTVPPIVELRDLDSRPGRSLSGSDSIIVQVSPAACEITHKTLVAWSDVSHFHDSARGDRRKNSIQTP